MLVINRPLWPHFVLGEIMNLGVYSVRIDFRNPYSKTFRPNYLIFLAELVYVFGQKHVTNFWSKKMFGRTLKLTECLVMRALQG